MEKLGSSSHNLKAQYRFSPKVSGFAQFHIGTMRIPQMPPRIIGDPKHWRGRAARMRTLAITMVETQAGILLTDQAGHYDELAERALIKANGPGRSTFSVAPSSGCEV